MIAKIPRIIMGLSLILLLWPAHLAAQNTEDPVRIDLSAEVPRIIESPNQDLYLRIYNNMQYQAPKVAARRVANFLGVASEDIVALSEEEIPEAFEEYCGQFTIFKDVERCREDILDAFLFELELFRLEAELEEETYASEVWSNGSLHDSSFDLLVDLNVIDVLLFGKAANPIVERFPHAASREQDEAGERGESGSGGESATGVTPTQPPELPPNILSDVRLSDVSIDEFFGEQELLPFDIDSDSTDICIESDTLQLFIVQEQPALAVRRSEGREVVLGEAEDRPVQAFASSVPTGGAGYPSTSFDENDSDEGCEGDEIFGLFCLDFDTKWCADLQTGDTDDMLYLLFNICLEVNFKTGSDMVGTAGGERHSKTDHCVDCHLTYINKTLRDLMNHALTPRRNTKSANFEIASAFDFLTDVGFNVVVSWEPVLVDKGDPFDEPGSKEQLEEVGSESEEAKSNVAIRREENLRKIYETGDRYGDFNEIIPNSKAYQRRLQRLRETMSHDQALRLVREQIEAIEQQRRDVFKQLEITENIHHNSKYWEAVSLEFASFYAAMKNMGHMYNYLGTVVAPKLEGKLECRVKQETNE